MASNILVESARNQDIKVLRQKNSFLSEQLSALKAQISGLEGSISKYEEDKKTYADTLLCINCIWQQLNADVASLCARVGAAEPAAAAAAAAAVAAAAGGAPEDAAAAAAAVVAGASGGDGGDASQQPQQEQEDLEMAWDSYDPFLARLLQGDAASSAKAIKKHAREYVADLSTAEQALHVRAAASLAALSSLLGAIEARNAAAAVQHEQMRALSADEALKGANQQLHEEVVTLQEQLDAANALHRSAQVRAGCGWGGRGQPAITRSACSSPPAFTACETAPLLLLLTLLPCLPLLPPLPLHTPQTLVRKAQDKAYQAEKDLQEIKNDLADKEFALEQAQRKLERVKQQQASAGGTSAGGAGPAAAAPAAAAAAAAAAGSAGAGTSAAGSVSEGGAAAAAAAAEAAEEIAGLQAQVAQLRQLLEQRTAEKLQEGEAATNAQR
jgi:hypothetical protein